MAIETFEAGSITEAQELIERWALRLAAETEEGRKPGERIRTDLSKYAALIRVLDGKTRVSIDTRTSLYPQEWSESGKRWYLRGQFNCRQLFIFTKFEGADATWVIRYWNGRTGPDGRFMEHG